jgi:hypothetical protein
LSKGLIEARVQMGNLYLLSRNSEKAREQAEKVLAKDPKNASGHLLMSSCLCFGEGNEILKINPDSFQVHLGDSS